MKKVVISSIGLALALAASSCYADFVLPTGPYASLEGGYGFLNMPKQSMNTNGGDYSITNFLWGANVGYSWGLDSYSTIGLEAGYNDNGQAKYDGSGAPGDTGSMTLTNTNWDILATFMTYWPNGWNMFVKVGPAYTTQKKDMDGTVIINGYSFTNQNNTDNEFDAMFVLGVGYLVSSNVNLYAEASYVNGVNHNSFEYVEANSNVGDEAASVYAAKVGISVTF
jgi:hypothetical protein